MQLSIWSYRGHRFAAVTWCVLPGPRMSIVRGNCVCIKTGLLKTTEEVCGTTRPHRWHRETWWWNEHVEKAIAAKPTAFKAWKAGKGTRASYDEAKRNARHAVHHARQEADKKVYENIDPKSSEVYRLANQFRRENTDVVGDKPGKNDAGELSMREDSKQKAWLEHYQRLLGPRPPVISITSGRPAHPNHHWYG